VSKWQTSGRRAPCPVCGRDKGDKCRWNDTTISCWWGDRFSPPPNIRRGDVLEVDGQPWAVVNLAGGFGANSCILKPHVERERLSPLQRRQRQAAVAAAKPALRQRMGKLADLMRRIRKVPDLERLRLDHLRLVTRNLDRAQQTARTLRVDLYHARRDDRSLGPWIGCVDAWSRELVYARRDMTQWWRRHLETPTRGRRRPPKPIKRHTRQPAAAAR
jgi:hypothetical protein